MKFKNITDTDMTLRGVNFPAGKAVEVKDDSLIQKLMGMPQFEEAKRGRKSDDQEAH